MSATGRPGVSLARQPLQAYPLVAVCKCLGPAIARRTATGGSALPQRVLQVGDQVLLVLEADRHPHQALADADLLAHLDRHA